MTPLFAGLSHERLDREGARPGPAPRRPGEASLCAEEFATPDGRARPSAASCPEYKVTAVRLRPTKPDD
ncbi:hypothetical protein AB0O51_16870 [Streptomyces sp. NPDC090301]|uniref:hypothetical protein n=1 Tax=Streptomyces sp. NPDC090301 TaxID=3154975 RepID=UPI00343DBE9D